MSSAHRVCAGVLAAALLWAPVLAQADVFDEARKLIDMRAAGHDLSGFSLQGGAHLQGVHQAQVELLRAQGMFNSSCGTFGFIANLEEEFSQLGPILKQTMIDVASNAPLLVLCYAAPSLCDVVKHVMAMANTRLMGQYQRCQAIQNAMMYTGKRLHGGEEGKCLQDASARGETISNALESCSSIPTLHTPEGGTGVRVNLIQDTMQAVGASNEMRQIAGNLLGEVRLEVGNGGLSMDNDRPQRAMLSRYEDHRQAAEQALTRAVDEYRSTGQVRDTTLQNASVPGQPLPLAVIDALARLRHDPGRYQALVGKAVTQLGLIKLVWECHELEDQLSGATDENSQITDEERAILERKLRTLRANLAHVKEKVAAIQDGVQPALHAIVREAEHQQRISTQTGMQAPPAVQQGPFRYGRQTPLGYSR